MMFWRPGRFTAVLAVGNSPQRPTSRPRNPSALAIFTSALVVGIKLRRWSSSRHTRDRTAWPRRCGNLAAWSGRYSLLTGSKTRSCNARRSRSSTKARPFTEAEHRHRPAGSPPGPKCPVATTVTGRAQALNARMCPRLNHGN